MMVQHCGALLNPVHFLFELNLEGFSNFPSRRVESNSVNGFDGQMSTLWLYCAFYVFRVFVVYSNFYWASLSVGVYLASFVLLPMAMTAAVLSYLLFGYYLFSTST